jgi:O-antigen/teichoic acid export membrane protein
MVDTNPSLPDVNTLDESKKNKGILEIINVPEKQIDALWEEIGFHKPLAGFWFKLSLTFVGMIMAVFLVSFLFNVLYPWPESLGYRDISTSVFILFTTVFDLGTHMCMDRYIAESRIKNPKKMLQYIQYFIWYQMTTGLVQTTAISMYAIYIVPQTDLAYAIWLMLVVSTTQYPGFLSVFNGVLGSLQHFNKTELLNFISGEIFSRISEFGFLFLGRWYGSLHPEIGELMGIAIGSSVGLYVNQFFAMLLAAKFFSNTMKDENIKVRDCFRVEFDRALVKDALWFGVRTGLPNVYGLVVSLIITWEMILFVPQYATLLTLANLAGYFGGIMNLSMGVSMTPLIAESYLNNKKKLTQYYIGQSFRFTGLNQAFLLVILCLVYLVLDVAFSAFSLSTYALIIPFILPHIIRSLQQPYAQFADNILTGTNHPNFLLAIRFVEENLKLLLMTVWVVWLEIPKTSGISTIAWVLVCGQVIATLFKTIASYIYIDKKILPLKIPIWQTFGAPFISGTLLFGVGFIFKITIFDYIIANYDFMIAIIIIALIFTGLSLGLYHPVATMLGGYDDEYMVQFKKAVKMSGPSKWIASLIYNEVALFRKHSPLHNRFMMHADEAHKEAQALFIQKFSNANPTKIP